MHLMRVVAEVVAARIVDGDVRYAVMRGECPRVGDPEATARADLATLFPNVWLKKTLVSSTGWRYENERVVLTFLGYSDEFDLDKLPLALGLTALDAGTDTTMRVAAQAIRYLAHLVQTGAPAAGLLGSETRSWLIGVAPVAGGRLELRGAA
jgi:hypothetical protein